MVITVWFTTGAGRNVLTIVVGVIFVTRTSHPIRLVAAHALVAF